MPGAALARCALLAGAAQVVVDQRGGHRHCQFGRHLGEHVGLVFQRGHAHFQAAQWRRDVLQRPPVRLGRCQAQRGCDQFCRHMPDEAAVGVQHGALGQRGRDLAGGQVRQVGDISVQRRLLQRIGAQPVGHIAQRHTGPHRVQGLFWREQAAPTGAVGCAGAGCSARPARPRWGRPRTARGPAAGRRGSCSGAGSAPPRPHPGAAGPPAGQGFARQQAPGPARRGGLAGQHRPWRRPATRRAPRPGLRLVSSSGQPRCAGGGRLGVLCLLCGVQRGGRGVRQHRIARTLCGRQGVHAGGGHQPQRPPGAAFVGTGLGVEADPQRICFRQVRPLAARGAGGRGVCKGRCHAARGVPRLCAGAACSGSGSATPHCACRCCTNACRAWASASCKLASMNG